MDCSSLSSLFNAFCCCQQTKRQRFITWLCLYFLLLLVVTSVIVILYFVYFFSAYFFFILAIRFAAPLFCCIGRNPFAVEYDREPSESVSQETQHIVNDLHPLHSTVPVLKRQDDSSIDLRPWRSYTHAELSAATNNFDQSNLLGGGGQAIVFRGVETLDDGECALGRDIAVKRFYFVSNDADELHHANLQFKREVQALSRASHRNVVEFYGYCINGCERLLVYELVPNGSLHDCLFAPMKDHRKITVDWGQRLTIAKDAARGLDYLHNHCNINLVHLDIKPQNILIDEMLHAKIADFGLSKLICRDQTRLTRTLVGGTPGYRPPELDCLVEGWENNITKKADVYSFGIVLLQLASGRMVSGPPTVSAAPTFVMSGQTFRDAAFHLVKTQRTQLLLDASLGNKAGNSMVGLRMAEIGTLCVEINPTERPDMHQVSELLDGIK